MMNTRQLKSNLFQVLCFIMALMGILILIILLFHVAKSGIDWLDFQFLTSFPSRFPIKAGIKSALFGTLWLMGLTALISIPIGISTALYLEEYSKKGKIHTLIEVNISNLAGIPSIIYGILGLTLFVRFFQMGRTLLAGSLTMSLLILPIIIISSREALKSVPKSIKQGSYALGATKWQTIFHHVLPNALPGILTGVILALSRAIGETAPLIMIGALTYVAYIPNGPLDTFTSMPIQIFNWVSRPQSEFHNLAAAGILVLLSVLFLMNSMAVYIRIKSKGKLK